MTLMPKYERSWNLTDILQWLAILAIICIILKVYTLVLERLKKGTLGHSAEMKCSEKICV
eukprot:jgi/Antlo1/781/1431